MMDLDLGIDDVDALTGLAIGRARAPPSAPPTSPAWTSA
jgi:hypothetical protein